MTSCNDCAPRPASRIVPQRETVDFKPLSVDRKRLPETLIREVVDYYGDQIARNVKTASALRNTSRKYGLDAGEVVFILYRVVDVAERAEARTRMDFERVLSFGRRVVARQRRQAWNEAA